MVILAGLILVSAGALGSAISFCAGRIHKILRGKIGKLCTGLIMLSAAIWGLLIPAIESGTPIAVVLGVIIGIGAVKFAAQIERLPYNHTERTLLAALTLHNLPEGLAAGLAIGSGTASALPIIIAVAAQNIPDGALAALAFSSAGESKRRAFTLAALTGVIEFPAVIIGAVSASIAEPIMPFLLSFAAGAMVFAAVRQLLTMSSGR
ncbi:MAG: ZIP family metal transporter [Oscillospiraceae bacterium]|jgi:ZIP family zinc transporter|nr:ZIP family metal transporter [Oscillospiraceae bacterium]